MLSNFNNFFDEDAYNANDKYAKEHISGYLVTKGYDVQENPDKYGIDLLIYRSGQYKASVEVQCCRSPNWGSGQRFPFPTHQAPYRKNRYVGESGHYLATINAFGTDAICSDMWSTVPDVTTKDAGRGDNEPFLNFPTGNAFFWKLNNN